MEEKLLKIVFLVLTVRWITDSVANGNRVTKFHQIFQEQMAAGVTSNGGIISSYIDCALESLMIAAQDGGPSFAYNKATQECFLYDRRITLTESTSPSSGLITFIRAPNNGSLKVCNDSSYTPFPILGICLKKYDVAVDWITAFQACANENSRLLYMKQFLNVFDAVEQLLSSDHRNYWLGAKANVNGTWTWTDGVLMDMNNVGWKTGEPNQYTDEYCLRYSNIHKVLTDKECTTTHVYICEKAMDIVHTCNP